MAHLAETITIHQYIIFPKAMNATSIFLWIIIQLISVNTIAHSKKKPNQLLLETPWKHGNPSESSRIQGGVTANAHEFPWLVRKFKDGKHSCGGTILNTNYVLTAAHCVYEEPLINFVFISGDHNIRCEEGGEQVHKILHIKIHEDFDKYLTQHDVAVVKVDPPFKFSRYVRPGRLVGKTFIYPEKLTPVGWGRIRYNGIVPDKLRKVTIHKQDDSKCNESTKPDKFNTTINLCYLGEKNQSTCTGDSGSPVHCRSGVDGTVEVCSIVSWGFKCSIKGHPSVLVRLTYYLDWIRLHSNTFNRAPLPRYTECGGRITGDGTVIHREILLIGQECHWVIQSFYLEKTFKILNWHLSIEDEVFFTNLTSSDICAGCTPLKFDRNRLDQTYTLSGTTPYVIVSVRINNCNPDFTRSIEIEFTSSGKIATTYPITDVQYYTRRKNGAILYPEEPDTYYLTNMDVFVLINPLQTQYTNISFRWTKMDIDSRGFPDRCPGDRLSFYRIDAGGSYKEYHRFCGDFIPFDFTDEMNGLVIMKFQSTLDTAFGHGFGLNYTILREKPGG